MSLQLNLGDLILAANESAFVFNSFSWVWNAPDGDIVTPNIQVSSWYA
jgi:hypothetical protein